MGIFNDICTVAISSGQLGIIISTSLVVHGPLFHRAGQGAGRKFSSCECMLVCRKAKAKGAESVSLLGSVMTGPA